MERIGWSGRARWRASLVHGGVMAALLAGVASLWTVLALVVALLAQPVNTMTILQRDGARGLPQVVRQGTAKVVSELRDGLTGKGAR